MEWGNCINGGNNKYYSYPANMYDGRNFAEWRPGAVVNTTIRNNNSIYTNWDYRSYLQKNSDAIITANQLLACNRCCSCPYYDSGRIRNQPFLFKSCSDFSKPAGYESGDLKEVYLSRQDLESRMFVPYVDQNILLPLKRAN